MVCAAIEAQIAELESEADRQVFLENTAKGVRIKSIGTCRYHLLNLITYFTAGEKEVRAWTIHRAGRLLRQPA